MRFVLDNSVVCGWLFEDQATPYCDSVAQLLRTSRAVAPPLLPLEYTNVLRTACKRQKILAITALDMIQRLASLPIDIDGTPPNTSQILDLALRYELSSYDASYLDLALRLGLPIATRDDALARAALVAGVGVLRAPS